MIIRHGWWTVLTDAWKDVKAESLHFPLTQMVPQTLIVLTLTYAHTHSFAFRLPPPSLSSARSRLLRGTHGFDTLFVVTGLVWQLVAIIWYCWYRLNERLIHTNLPQQTHFKPQRQIAFQLAITERITNPVPSICHLQTHFSLNMVGGNCPKWISTTLLSVLYGWNLNRTH